MLFFHLRKMRANPRWIRRVLPSDDWCATSTPLSSDAIENYVGFGVETTGIQVINVNS